MRGRDTFGTARAYKNGKISLYSLVTLTSRTQPPGSFLSRREAGKRSEQEEEGRRTDGSEQTQGLP